MSCVFLHCFLNCAFCCPFGSHRWIATGTGRLRPLSQPGKKNQVFEKGRGRNVLTALPKEENYFPAVLSVTARAALRNLK
jgi:hypothetical protein